LSYSVSYTQSGMGRYWNGMGTVRERYGERLELRYGAVWDGWVWYMGAVWSSIGAAVWDRYGMIGFGIRERYGSSIGAAIWDVVESFSASATAERSPMTPLVTYFFKI